MAVVLDWANPAGVFFKSFEDEDLMIMRAIDQRLGTKSDWIREIIRKFL